METTTPIAPARSPETGQPNPGPPDPAQAPADLPDLTPEELQVAAALSGDGSRSPYALAAELKIEGGVRAFLTIARRPAVQKWVDAATEVEAFRIELLARRAKADAIEALATITRDTEAEPVERRRAATAILRALRPPPARRPAGDTTGKPQGAPPPEPPHEPTPEPEPDPEAEARALLEQQRKEWEEDGEALRRRYDFTTGQRAAESVAKILTTADPRDPEPALKALFLVTWPSRNFENTDKFFACTRYLTAAARGSVSRLERVKQISYWAGFHLTVQPRSGPKSGPPLDLFLWIAEPLYENDQAWLVSILPWNNGAALDTHPGSASTIALDKVTHLAPPTPPPDPEPP